jgi:sterol desaturase/sphingolipid hydroxylase (fatty acid hydroxylase superfamily)
MNYQEWIVAHSKTIQLVAFFGWLLVFGILETWIPESSLPANRKKRWVTNFGVSLVGALILSLLPVSGIVASTWAAKAGFGLLNRIALPALALLILTFAARSLSSWALHIIMHKIPFLWRVHRTHHLDRVMDISTTVRFSPLELLLSLLVGILTIALLGLPAWALMVYAPLESAVRCFSHANIHLPKRLDQSLRLLIATPAMHRMHHSINWVETDSNYGAIFSFWDRLFRTYTTPEGKDLAGMPLGLEGNEGSEIQSFWWLLGNPLKK